MVDPFFHRSLSTVVHHDFVHRPPSPHILNFFSRPPFLSSMFFIDPTKMLLKICGLPDIAQKLSDAHPYRWKQNCFMIEWTPCTGENDPMGSSIGKWQCGFCTTDLMGAKWRKMKARNTLTFLSGGLAESGRHWRFWIHRHSFRTHFVIFFNDEPIGSFSPVQGDECAGF